MVQKASTPWSTRTVAEGGTDSPVGDLVPVPDKITPVVSTGFIATSGKFTGLPANDLAFTFQDPSQALAAGATIFIDVNMLQYDTLVLAILDSSGNAINIDIIYTNPATAQGPYNNPTFLATGIDGSFIWNSNRPRADGALQPILNDTSENLTGTWRFFRVDYMNGTVGTINIVSNEGADAGTISTAYLRLV